MPTPPGKLMPGGWLDEVPFAVAAMSCSTSAARGCRTARPTLGGMGVSTTIRKGIADIKCYDDDSLDPGMLMYGFLAVVGAVGFWLLLATFLEMPVSTTHSCVGGMIGMTIVLKGSDCVVWLKETDADKLYIPSGVVRRFPSPHPAAPCGQLDTCEARPLSFSL